MHRFIFRKRLLEWMTSFILVGIGLIMLVFPASFDRPNYQIFSDHSILWLIACLGVGVLRMIALVINGSWNGGTPLLRLIGSISGMGIFGAFLGNLLQVSTVYSVPFSVATYLGLMLGELLSSFYTASDMINVRKYGS
jgi:hypothetical protein